MDKLRKDLMLLFGILLAAFFCWLAASLSGRRTPAVVRIFQDGREISVYPVSEDVTMTIPYGEVNYNVMLINNGQVSVRDADCPDKLCVKQKAISKNGESIICLPHKLVIQIESEEESGLDTLTY